MDTCFSAGNWPAQGPGLGDSGARNPGGSGRHFPARTLRLSLGGSGRHFPARTLRLSLGSASGAETRGPRPLTAAPLEGSGSWILRIARGHRPLTAANRGPGAPGAGFRTAPGPVGAQGKQASGAGGGRRRWAGAVASFWAKVLAQFPATERGPGNGHARCRDALVGQIWWTETGLPALPPKKKLPATRATPCLDQRMIFLA